MEGEKLFCGSCGAKFLPEHKYCAACGQKRFGELRDNRSKKPQSKVWKLLYGLWVSAHFLVLMIYSRSILPVTPELYSSVRLSRSSKKWNNHDFWLAFRDSWDSLEIYDLREFLVYIIVPLAVFYVTKNLAKSK